MGIALGANRYGKAEVRLVHVLRGAPDHQLVDLNVSVSLAGDLAGTHLRGDNSAVLPTDTQKTTVYAFAGGARRRGHRGLRAPVWPGTSWPARPPSHRALVTIEQYPWTRLGPYSFQRSGGYVRTAPGHRGPAPMRGWCPGPRSGAVEHDGVGVHRVHPGPVHTTLAETTDRILATAVNAQWRHARPDGGRLGGLVRRARWTR